MFERYTEKARRVIFFARYEASQYGSHYIDSEHLLLGLIRENKALVQRFLKTDAAEAIRVEIEAQTKRNPRIPTSVEMPLSQAGKEILNRALEEADRFGHKHVGTEHLLVAMLLLEGSVACQLLQKYGVKLQAVRDAMAKGAEVGPAPPPRPSIFAVQEVDGFLAALKESSAKQVIRFFAKNAQLVDFRGQRWSGLEEIDAESFLSLYAKKNAKPIIEAVDLGTGESVAASILWKDIIAPGETKPAIHRMTILFGPSQGDWKIFLLQVTPIIAER